MIDITTCHGKRFDARHGETILDAALRHEVALDYSCRTGRCGTCRARVLDGSTTVLHEESALSAVELTGGWILTCVRTANSALELDVQDLGSVLLYPVKTLPCRIHSLERLTSDVLKVVLRLPPSSGFDYHPGQYIDVIGHGGLSRSYSIANAPSSAGHLELHIRQVDDGAMSDYWFVRARESDLLRLRGPHGTFFLRDVSGMDLIFLATGTGIAPVKAMLEDLAANPQKARPRSIAVYWGGRSLQDIYWQPSDIDIAHRFVPVLSRADDSWPGARGHVQRQLLSDEIELRDAMVHACGGQAMIDEARQLLGTAGLPARNFHADAFVPSGATS